MSRLSEIDFWGDALRRWPAAVFSGFGLSDADVSYLVDIGLPAGVDWTISIDPPVLGAALTLHAGMPIVAHDTLMPICIDGDRADLVVVCEPGHHRPVNSNVRVFGTFLMLYQEYRLKVMTLEDDEAEHLIDETEQRMRALEPRLMSDSEAYWPVVVEQMRDGLL